MEDGSYTAVLGLFTFAASGLFVLFLMGLWYYIRERKAMKERAKDRLDFRLIETAPSYSARVECKSCGKVFYTTVTELKAERAKHRALIWKRLIRYDGEGKTFICRACGSTQNDEDIMVHETWCDVGAALEGADDA